MEEKVCEVKQAHLLNKEDSESMKRICCACKKALRKVKSFAAEAYKKLNQAVIKLYAKMKEFIANSKLRSESGQATTEYAILVGVLVVIAIVAITAFRGKLSSLWDSITAGINGL